MKKLSFAVSGVIILFAILVFSQRPMTVEAQTPARISPDVAQAIQVLQSGEMVSVMVTLRQQANLPRLSDVDRATRQIRTITALQQKASISQKNIIELLQMRQQQGSVEHFQSFWIFNGLEVMATPAIIRELAARPEVESITMNEIISAPVLETSAAAAATPEANLSLINAPEMWNAGFTGQGIVVALMDTGVDASHPDLAAQYRGGTNSWFDPYGQHATPADLSGHGTQVLGVMVGRDNGGTSIGAAPDAQWIAVKLFDDSGKTTTANIHAGFQWLLDPDGDPNTDDAPDVVNNSWSVGAGPGCNLDFQPDLQALLAAGILPIFSAGNYGSTAGSGASPANNPEAFAVGAINNSSAIWPSSSRGPSACGESSTIFPEVVAPGVDIKTTDRAGNYFTVSGTSIAAPHVSGGLALLLSAFPQMDASAQRDVLLQSAVRLSGDGQPDNNTGYGRIDLWAAYQRIGDTRVAATAGAPAVDYMQPLTYTVSITHAGPATAAITVTGTFSGTTVDILSAETGQGSCATGSNVYSCTLGIMPAGVTTATFTGTATVPITIVMRAHTNGVLYHTVSAANNVIEGAPADNQITITTDITPYTIFLPLIFKE